MKAKDLLQKGESAIVIFTDGVHFHRKPNGTGWTGDWAINPNRDAIKVVV